MDSCVKQGKMLGHQDDLFFLFYLSLTGQDYVTNSTVCSVQMQHKAVVVAAISAAAVVDGRWPPSIKMSKMSIGFEPGLSTDQSTNSSPLSSSQHVAFLAV